MRRWQISIGNNKACALILNIIGWASNRAVYLFRVWPSRNSSDRLKPLFAIFNQSSTQNSTRQDDYINSSSDCSHFYS
jgi:hypothetical protein